MCGKQLMQSGIYSRACVMFVTLFSVACNAYGTVHTIFDDSVGVIADPDFSFPDPDFSIPDFSIVLTLH
jgi:hypothetical protein